MRNVPNKTETGRCQTSSESAIMVQNEGSRPNITGSNLEYKGLGPDTEICSAESQDRSLSFGKMESNDFDITQTGRCKTSPNSSGRLRIRFKGTNLQFQDKPFSRGRPRGRHCNGPTEILLQKKKTNNRRHIKIKCRKLTLKCLRS